MNNLKLYLYIIVVLTPISLLCQDRIIDISKNNGVYYLQCKINGYPIEFILDSGASDVIISEKEAEVLKAQGLISNSDFINTESYEIADGSIIHGESFIISQFQIGSEILYNVKASVIKGSNNSCLLGQSALEQLGYITIDYTNSKLIISESTKSLDSYLNNTWTCGNNLFYNGYSYETVDIGDLCWFGCNLQTNSYSNGDVILNNLSDYEWENTSNGAYVMPLNNPDFEYYGYWYNWFAVEDRRGLCPSGWHVATDFNWKNLFSSGVTLEKGSYITNYMFLNKEEELKICNKLKTHFGWWNNNGSNELGFNAYPAGFYPETGIENSYNINNGVFVGIYTSWWQPPSFPFGHSFFRSEESKRQAKAIELEAIKHNVDAEVIEIWDKSGKKSETYQDKNSGASVRCVKD